VINREVFARRSTSKDKVKREIMLHKDLIHPNVVGFCHFFSDDRSNVHIILEYCAMKSLLVSYTPGVRLSCLPFCQPNKLEQHALKNANNCLNANIYSYLETSGGQSSNLYLNVVHFFNASVN